MSKMKLHDWTLFGYFLALIILIIVLLTLWSAKLFYTILKSSFYTSKETQHYVLMNISRLMIFKDIDVVYTENHVKSLNRFFANLLKVKVIGMIATVGNHGISGHKNEV